MSNAKHKLKSKALALLLGLAMILAMLPLTAYAIDDPVYALLNIPYDDFYKAVGVAAFDYDAVTSATNKVGNYSLTGGVWHPQQTASVDGGVVTAVGADNGAELKGVTWPVKTTQAALTALGGTQITADAKKTVASFGRGATTATQLVGYETLMEAPQYSYYLLDSAPEYYFELAENGTLTIPAGQAAEEVASPSVTVSYGGAHSDVTLKLTDTANGISNNQKLINAAVLTFSDGTTATKTGFVHFANLWLSGELGWYLKDLSGLDGKTITNITLYCSVKDADTKDDTAPAYANYIYSYNVETPVSPIYQSAITAAFDSAEQISLTGLPADADNLKAMVYTTTGSGKNAVKTYLTPLAVDPKDDDIDPQTVSVVDGKITITASSVTNKAGVTKLYGYPAGGATYTIELSADNWVFSKQTATYSGGADKYALVNLPYGVFYNTIGASDKSRDYDAVTSATNKVGNYGKAGGSFHSAASAGKDDENNDIATGAANGAKIEGVTWAVKLSDPLLGALEALGGQHIEADAAKTVATAGRGSTTVTELVSYETLMEAPAYSYFVLDSAPTNYMTLSLADGAIALANSETPVSSSAAAATVTYGGHHADIALNLTGNTDVSDKLINAAIVSFKDSKNQTSKVGFVHIANIWAANEIGWDLAKMAGLDGQTVTNITFYCSVKDADTKDDTAPAYVNYVYSYDMNVKVTPVYTGKMTARFDSASQITVTGLPDDAENVKATVYHTDGGRPATLTYLTPLAVSDLTDDILPAAVDVESGKIAIDAELKTVENKAGDSMTYGQPVINTEYVIELTSDNWVLGSLKATYADNSGSDDDGGSSAKPSVKNEDGAAFADVPSDAYYSDAVEWAAASGLLDSTSGDFGPEETCTREEVVLFLWKLAGRPEPETTACPFTDVSETSASYKAILWAVEKGITLGTSSDTFSPLNDCDRAQIVTLLARYAKGEAADVNTSFADVSAKDYFAPAVAWAVENGVTNGTSAATFSPHDDCSRAQIVTFLYRYAGK